MFPIIRPIDKKTMSVSHKNDEKWRVGVSLMCLCGLCHLVTNVLEVSEHSVLTKISECCMLIPGYRSCKVPCQPKGNTKTNNTVWRASRRGQTTEGKNGGSTGADSWHARVYRKHGAFL